MHHGLTHTVTNQAGEGCLAGGISS
jgi:hypothetical protein